MNKRQKIKLAIFLVFIAFLIVYITVIGISNRVEKVDISLADAIGIQTDTQNAYVCEEERDSINNSIEVFEVDNGDTLPTVGEIIKNIILQKDSTEVLAQITIETDRKIRTYDVMEGVGEKTLKKDVGWLPSSTLPGQEGLCVLMAHRDMEFKILKYAQIGDKISVSYNDKVYNYTVSKIKIFDIDEQVTFESSANSGLTLVTCYPFYCSGNAPRKIVITCKLHY
jgi:sortase A